VEAWVQGLTDPEDKIVADPVLAIAKQVQEQDVQISEEGKASLIKGVAKDRRISVEDSEMRHGRKSRSVRVDGYKRHVLHDLDSSLIRAVGITPANVAEASVTEAISEDLEQQGVCLKELHIDRAYLSSHLVRERSDELEVYCKAWPVRQRKRFSKQAFTRDLGTTDHPVSNFAGNALCARRCRSLSRRDLREMSLANPMHDQF
jgi:transposase